MPEAPPLERLLSGIQQAVRAEIDTIMAEEIDAAVKRTQQRFHDLAPKVAMRLMSHFEVSRRDQSIVIEVRQLLPEAPPN